MVAGTEGTVVQFLLVPSPTWAGFTERGPGSRVGGTQTSDFPSALGRHGESGSILGGDGGVHLPLVFALWGSVACTMPNWAWEHLQGSRWSGTFWNDECACLDLNETESADTVSGWKLKGWRTPFSPLEKRIFFQLQLNSPLG